NKPGIDCNVRLELDYEAEERNAYFTYAELGKKSPVIRFTVPILQDAQSDDEVAFILGHEYGHLIGQHIDKQQKQAIAGALIMGTLMAAAGGGNTYDADAVNSGIELGAALGHGAFSKTYELESDMLGARIAASAGYDPVKGARYFARDEEARSESGKLSFWGTHPADAERIAVVIATSEQIKARQALVRKEARK
ncbi:M48 family metalloprotease, partial [Escherichia coli]|nr:M48 family metalloprotease [Escherichia coli]